MIRKIAAATAGSSSTATMAGLLTTNPQPASPPARQTARTETYRLQLYRAMLATSVAIPRALLHRPSRLVAAHREIGAHPSVGPDVRARR